jgi:hypothetical protein
MILIIAVKGILVPLAYHKMATITRGKIFIAPPFSAQLHNTFDFMVFITAVTG